MRRVKIVMIAAMIPNPPEAFHNQPEFLLDLFAMNKCVGSENLPEGERFF